MAKINNYGWWGNCKFSTWIFYLHNDAFLWGDGYISNDKIPHGAHLSSPVFESYGFQEGDLIVEVGGEKVIEFGTAEKRILIDGERKIKN